MLKKRIIPTLLWKDFGLVKGKQFYNDRRVGTVLPAVKVYNMRCVDELIFLDITATEKKGEPNYQVIEEFSEECFVPLTVGGGISKLEHAKRLFRVGADKVLLNTACYENPGLVEECASFFGSQSIVVGIDFKESSRGQHQTYKNSGKELTGYDPCAWAKMLESLGAGEILLTSIDRDGMLSGYDLDVVNQVCEAVKIPVIVSGGAGSYEDFYEVFSQTRASAVSAASLFHFTEQTPNEAKKYLFERKIPVRVLT